MNINSIGKQKTFWKNKKIFLTGHTGFKGSWLVTWLNHMGAQVYGYALEPEFVPNLFSCLQLQDKCVHKIADIRDLKFLTSYMNEVDPDVVFHMAAQPFVRKSYGNPTETFETNVMGTVNILESIRLLTTKKTRSIVVVTTDKCYENKEWHYGYREEDAMGGYDPYSSSKAAAELVTASYRSSFFHPKRYNEHLIGLASARAGNVIGGGDWSVDRLVPDIIKYIESNNEVPIRNPNAIRPWQHVLEPLSGYLILAQKLYEQGEVFSQAFNFGPNAQDTCSVIDVTKKICDLWPTKGRWILKENIDQLHEAHCLKLEISKANALLSWTPKWNIDESLAKTVDWYYAKNSNQNMFDFTLKQIHEYITIQNSHEVFNSLEYNT